MGDVLLPTDRQILALVFAVRWPELGGGTFEAVDRFLKHGPSWAIEREVKLGRTALARATGGTQADSGEAAS